MSSDFSCGRYFRISIFRPVSERSSFRCSVSLGVTEYPGSMRAYLPLNGENESHLVHSNLSTAMPYLHRISERRWSSLTIRVVIHHAMVWLDTAFWKDVGTE